MRAPPFLRLGATADLLKRYRVTFCQAWRARRQLDAPRRLSHEAEFLPAVLALQDTPITPAPRIAMWLLLLFSLCALLWAIWGEIDIVATARGKILPNDRIKVIQSMETAVVRAIHVTDGEPVQAGQLLVELDDTAALADTLRLADDLASERLEAARGRALLDAIAKGTAPKIEPMEDIDPARVAQEQRVLEGQYQELRAQLAQLNADIAQRQAELRSTQEIVRKLEQTVPIARQRAEDYGRLVDKHFVARHGYLEREQERIEQEADLAAQRSRINELRAALLEARQQQTTLIAQTRRATLDSLNAAEQKARSARQDLIKAETRAQLMKLTAPVEGFVQQLAVHTVGGVVTPAQPLMVIVPKNHPLEIEAFVENKDIGFVNPGQKAEIKIETFPFTRYGTLHGRVTQVSNDAVSDEKRGLIYSARIEPETTAMQVDGKTVNVSPGMAVTVEIKTGKRRLVEYFLSPLIQHTSESLHER
jgi:hemolysin D